MVRMVVASLLLLLSRDDDARRDDDLVSSDPLVVVVRARRKREVIVRWKIIVFVLEMLLSVSLYNECRCVVLLLFYKGKVKGAF